MSAELKPLSPNEYARRLRSVVVRFAEDLVSRSITVRDENARKAVDRYDFSLLRAELHEAIAEAFRWDLPPGRTEARWALAGVLAGLSIETPTGPVSLAEALAP